MGHKNLRAAEQLEELSADIKQAVIDLREHHRDSAWCYARVYYLRKRMGGIVASMGAGIPSISEGKMQEKWLSSALS